MRYLTIPFLLLTAVALSQGQPTRDGVRTAGQAAHEIPFASTGNLIELTIENTSLIPQSSVTVRAEALPVWLTLEPQEFALGELAGQAERTVRFTFAVDRTAPVNADHTLVFTVNGDQAQSWSKTVALRIAPPESFELFQNYPNPFNPTTTIAYQLPWESRVRLVVYDLVGQEVATLVDADRAPGFHQTAWDASALASGLYVCRITAAGRGGTRSMQNRMMMLVR